MTISFNAGAANSTAGSANSINYSFTAANPSVVFSCLGVDDGGSSTNKVPQVHTFDSNNCTELANTHDAATDHRPSNLCYYDTSAVTTGSYTLEGTISPLTDSLYLAACTCSSDAGTLTVIGAEVQLDREVFTSDTDGTMSVTLNTQAGDKVLVSLILDSGDAESAVVKATGQTLITSTDISAGMTCALYEQTASGTSTTVTFTYTTGGSSTGSIIAVPVREAIAGPSITSITDPITTGGTATITGTGFGATQGASTVTQNGVTLSVNSWSDTSIEVVTVDIESSVLKYGNHTFEVTVV